jgi:hypothetical protein
MPKSKYTARPYGLDRVRTYPLGSRPSKVGVGSFARPHRPGGSVRDFLGKLPGLLGAENLNNLAHAIVAARGAGKPVLWGLGGHVIKTGLAPVLIDLMDRGFVSGVALNGAGMIHDFEVALNGSTSEDVETQLGKGDFGMASETGHGINEAVRAGVSSGLGIGESVGSCLESLHPPFADYSLLLQAYRRSIPVTVHVTIGADIIHIHPGFASSETGQGSHRDFLLFAGLVAALDGGGVYVNCGSAVTLPEVFLKCVSLVRNSGDRLQEFTTANLDFIQHYRPTENVIRRPVKPAGRGIPITGHHEILIPLLAAWITELSADSDRDN